MTSQHPMRLGRLGPIAIDKLSAFFFARGKKWSTSAVLILLSAASFISIGATAAKSHSTWDKYQWYDLPVGP